MAQLSKDAFAAGDRPLSVDEAVELLLDRVPAVNETEALGLLDADGRILAAPFLAPIDLPSFDNSAVDGYGVRFSDLAPADATRLPIGGRVAAGHSLSSEALARQAIRIFTGAPIPAGIDTIFMQEDCKVEAMGGEVVLPPGLKQGANLRRRAEDLRQGFEALSAGRRLTPEDIALAAALGVQSLTVRRRLKAAVFSTGDEIVSPGEPLREAAVYDANRFLLQSLLRRLGVEVTDLGILSDDCNETETALAAAAEHHDLVVTSGGVSMGEADHVKAAIGNVGSLVFWKLAIKPGRPVAMSVIKGTPLIGLPGNPVAVFITFAYIVRPLIAALNGSLPEGPRVLPVSAGFSYKKKQGRREYVRVSLRRGENGDFFAEKYPIEGAGVLTSLTRTQGLVELREEVVTVAPGEKVGFIDYGLIR